MFLTNYIGPHFAHPNKRNQHLLVIYLCWLKVNFSVQKFWYIMFSPFPSFWVDKLHEGSLSKLQCLPGMGPLLL